MADNEKYKNLKKFNDLVWEYREQYHGIGREYGLGDSAIWILYVMRMWDKAFTQRDICKWLHQPKQTVNKSLQKMTELGFIELRYAEGSKKNKEIFMTPKGMDLAEKTADKIIEAELRTMSNLSEKEQDIFLELFGKYVGILRGELSVFRGTEASE